MRPDKLHVDAVSEVLHRLAEDRVIHELEEVLLEVGSGPPSELGVQGDVWLHPRPLLELGGFCGFSSTSSQDPGTAGGPCSARRTGICFAGLAATSLSCPPAAPQPRPFDRARG